jgi:mannose-6-phosphate isomerase-like protein (cupin superfamily)
MAVTASRSASLSVSIRYEPGKIAPGIYQNLVAPRTKLKVFYISVGSMASSQRSRLSRAAMNGRWGAIPWQTSRLDCFTEKGSPMLKQAFMVMTGVVLACGASGAEPPTVMFVSGAEVAQRISQGDTLVQSDKPVPASSLPSWGPFQGHLGYRTAPQPLIYTNDDFAEYWAFMEGEGTVSLGGTLVNPKRTGPHAEAPTVQGATTYRVIKGDMIMIPPGVAHAISQVHGKLVYVSMHLQLHADTVKAAPAH